MVSGITKAPGNAASDRRGRYCDGTSDSPAAPAPGAGRPYRSFRGLLDHLATLTRNQFRYTGTQITIAMLTEPTSAQRQAFELIGAPIPLTLK